MFHQPIHPLPLPLCQRQPNGSHKRGRVMLAAVSVTEIPVFFSSFSMKVTELDGYFCFMTAKPPVTCGVAIEVPDLLPKVLVGIEELILTPGAMRSTCGPLLEKLATLSLSSTAPTVIAS